MIIMSVDLGVARTGIAVCDKTQSFAFPKCVIKEYNTDKLVDKICEKARELEAEQIVVGLPKNMDGSLGERAQICTEIAEKIREKSGLDLEMYDERCTTLEAYTLLDMNETYGKKRKENVDAVAATVILEGYLALLKNRKLFESQKETLDTFLKTKAISKEQYDISLNGLKTKMKLN